MKNLQVSTTPSIEEGEELIDDKQGDAALICAAQKVEHYEIADYLSPDASAK